MNVSEKDPMMVISRNGQWIYSVRTGNMGTSDLPSPKILEGGQVTRAEAG